jgi:hypothetical protein
MSFEILAGKYGSRGCAKDAQLEEVPVATPADDVAPVEPMPEITWRDSEKVVELSEYVKRNKSMGIRICMIDDTPGIRFDPPLARPEAGDAARRRWEISARAEELYHVAFEDLTCLIEMGLMTLPEAGPIAGEKWVLTGP